MFAVLVSLAMRWPFFFPAVLNWDESSSILMGQAVLEGFTPYADFFNLKPPLLFYSFAGFIALTGKSIVGIRILGSLCVAGTALGVHLLARGVVGRGWGYAASALTVLAASVTMSGQAVMTETVAILPLVFSALVLARHEGRLERFLLARRLDAEYRLAAKRDRRMIFQRAVR